MRQIFRKPCFTLLEILIALFIISFGIALTSVKIKELYQEQRFLSEIQQVLGHLTMAQDIMLIMDTDVQVKFLPDSKTQQIHVWLEVNKPLQPPWNRLIERHLVLDAIQSLKFEKRLVKNLTLQFSLGRMSKGTLALFQEDQSKQHSEEKDQKEHGVKIELLGYPSPIVVNQAGPTEKKELEKSKALYPAEVYKKLYEDPNENHANEE